MKEDNLKDELYPESVKSWEKIVHEAKKVTKVLLCKTVTQYVLLQCIECL